MSPRLSHCFTACTICNTTLLLGLLLRIVWKTQMLSCSLTAHKMQGRVWQAVVWKTGLGATKCQFTSLMLQHLSRMKLLSLLRCSCETVKMMVLYIWCKRINECYLGRSFAVWAAGVLSCHCCWPLAWPWWPLTLTLSRTLGVPLLGNWQLLLPRPPLQVGCCERVTRDTAIRITDAFWHRSAKHCVI